MFQASVSCLVFICAIVGARFSVRCSCCWVAGLRHFVGWVQVWGWEGAANGYRPRGGMPGPHSGCNGPGSVQNGAILADCGSSAPVGLWGGGFATFWALGKGWSCPPTGQWSEGRAWPGAGPGVRMDVERPFMDLGWTTEGVLALYCCTVREYIVPGLGVVLGCGTLPGLASGANFLSS